MSETQPVLAAQPWRLLCALSEDTPQDADPVLRPDERLDADAYATLCYELHHTVLPELAADGFVELDSAEETLWRGPRFETVRPLLDRPRGDLRELTGGPFIYDDDTDIIRYDPDASIEVLLAFLAAERDGRGGHN